jgi:hypothetical protein
MQNSNDVKLIRHFAQEDEMRATPNSEEAAALHGDFSRHNLPFYQVSAPCHDFGRVVQRSFSAPIPFAVIPDCL